MDLKDLPSSERSKIASLISKDKPHDEMNWMYNEKKDNAEAYLLGKSVSETEQLQKFGQDYEESSSQRIARIDMEAKFREDPLTIMKQREAEKRMELLRNTAKVKKLRRLLTIQKHQGEERRKHKKLTKHRKSDRSKKSRRSRSNSSSSSSESSSGDELLDKFIKIVRQSDEKEAKQKNEEPVQKSPSPPPSNRHEVRHHRPQHRPHVPSSSHSSNYQQHRKPKLSNEELELRRSQMMSDAKEHEKSRSFRTAHHNEKKRNEEQRDLIDRHGHGASFISRMKVDHAQRSTIEEGVHRKASSRQRGEMDSNFLRR